MVGRGIVLFITANLALAMITPIGEPLLKPVLADKIAELSYGVNVPKPEKGSAVWWELVIVNPTASSVTVERVRVNASGGVDLNWTVDVQGFPTTGWTDGGTAGLQWTGSQPVSAYTSTVWRVRAEVGEKTLQTYQFSAQVDGLDRMIKSVALHPEDMGASAGGLFYALANDLTEQTEVVTFADGNYTEIDWDVNNAVIKSSTEYSFEVNVHEWLGNAITDGSGEDRLYIRIPKEFTDVKIHLARDFEGLVVSGGGATDWIINGTNAAAISNSVASFIFNATTPKGSENYDHYFFNSSFTCSACDGKPADVTMINNMTIRIAREMTRFGGVSVSISASGSHSQEMTRYGSASIDTAVSGEGVPARVKYGSASITLTSGASRSTSSSRYGSASISITSTDSTVRTATRFGTSSIALTVGGQRDSKRIRYGSASITINIPGVSEVTRLPAAGGGGGGGGGQPVPGPFDGFLTISRFGAATMTIISTALRQVTEAETVIRYGTAGLTTTSSGDREEQITRYGQAQLTINQSGSRELIVLITRYGQAQLTINQSGSRELIVLRDGQARIGERLENFDMLSEFGSQCCTLGGILVPWFVVLILVLLVLLSVAVVVKMHRKSKDLA